MANCNNCGSMILFGGKRQGGYVFCNDRCEQQGALTMVGDVVPNDIVNTHVEAVHKGNCPKCNGPGPVDVHHSHTVWSAVFMTQWKSTPQISCKRCATSSQATGLVSSMLLGWWGFPWGIIMTPVQIVKNISAMASGPDPRRPSPELASMMRKYIALQAAQSGARDEEASRLATLMEQRQQGR